MTFTDSELAYLASQRLGRLATAAADGTMQNNPVGFRVDAERGTIDIGGHDLAASRKFRNVRVNPEVSFVVDDLASVDPWHVRGIEVRGRAEALDGTSPAGRQVRPRIRIHPRRILVWGGINHGTTGLEARNVG